MPQLVIERVRASFPDENYKATALKFFFDGNTLVLKEAEAIAMAKLIIKLAREGAEGLQLVIPGREPVK